MRPPKRFRRLRKTLRVGLPLLLAAYLIAILFGHLGDRLILLTNHETLDPHGAALYEHYACGELRAEGSSVAEGIGQGRITANLEGAPIDTQFRISDAEGYHWVRRLLDEEGLCLGLSSGINVAGAVMLAKQLGPRSRVATRVSICTCAT